LQKEWEDLCKPNCKPQKKVQITCIQSTQKNDCRCKYLQTFCRLFWIKKNIIEKVSMWL
jgi:hypothetical protein